MVVVISQRSGAEHCLHIVISMSGMPAAAGQGWPAWAVVVWPPLALFGRHVDDDPIRAALLWPIIGGSQSGASTEAIYQRPPMRDGGDLPGLPSTSIDELSSRK